jgi:integrase
MLAIVAASSRAPCGGLPCSAVKNSSAYAYRIAVRVHLIPGVGEHRLDRLRPEHLERPYRRMIATGAQPATAHQVHRMIRTVLGEAVRRRSGRRSRAGVGGLLWSPPETN